MEEGSSDVSLDTFIKFLVLCESSGYIELKLGLEELKENLQSLLNISQSPDSGYRIEIGERSSQTLEDEELNFDIATPSQSLSFDLQLSSIMTPEIGSTPLSAGGQTSTDNLTEHEEEGPGLSESGSTSPRGRRDTSFVTACTNLDHSDVSLRGISGGSCSERESSMKCSTLNESSAASELSERHLASKESLHRDDNELVEESLVLASLDKSHTVASQDVSSTSLKSVQSFNLDDEEDVVGMAEVTSDSINICGDDTGACSDQEEEVELSDHVTTGDEADVSCDNHMICISSDEDEEADDKLEKLFSDMKIRSTKKKHIASRKSLSVFIVSDSEEVELISDDEENCPPTPGSPNTATPTYNTPCTPASGIMFWGSPSTEIVKVQTTGSKVNRRPLGVQNHYGTPSALTFSTPVGKPTHKPPPLTTPSANKNFARSKMIMVQELYSLFNNTVFDNKLPTDMTIIWNKKLRTTAGYCCYEGGGPLARTARIELSTKVVDCYDRIRDTLIHEMCHAATWIINGIKGGGHGREWRAWADKANSVYADLKPITRCHSYSIQYKYTYKCSTCDFTTGRHSKSVNLVRARCPCCLSTLELLPRLKVDGTPAPERKLNRYAQFVKDHYGEVKSGSPWRSHREIMERLQQIYHQNSHQKETAAPTSPTFSL